ncbi:hypothetical protein [Thermus filiformis]|uniref:Uncharacterized protein n=1 Tax=Thermus filiformis TaxID=276 RepID=A0A0A2WXP7_THEFI|nr:hypothetical protein [Thermus filiformis]KGQ23065.1 hypothetical protein THFILI_00630 [Thermus filiformis]
MKKPILLTLTTLLLALPAPALGQTLTLTPVRLELLLPPSGGAQGSALLLVEGKRTALEVSLSSFLLGLDGSVREGASHERDLCPHLEVFPQGSLEVPEGGGVEVRVRVRPFSGEGTYWCMVLLQTAPSFREERGLRIGFRAGVGLFVYATFRGTERPGLALEGIGREGEELKLLLANTGNVLLRVTGTLLFYDKEGKEALRLSLDEEGVAVFPGSKRLLSFRPGLPSGYKVVVLLEHAYGRLAGEGTW